MYQPELGRFMQPDPKEFGAGDYNLYRYCHNDPVNKSDPFGFQEAIVGYSKKEYSEKELNKIFPNRDAKEMKKEIAADEKETRDQVKEHTQALQQKFGKDKDGKDRVEYRDVNSKKDAEKAAKDAPKVFLYAHGSLQEPSRIRLGSETVLRSELPKNIDVFGCSPGRPAGGLDVMRQIEVGVSQLLDAR